MMLRGAWRHLQHEAARLAIVVPAELDRNFKRGLALAGRADYQSLPEDILSEFQLLTLTPPTDEDTLRAFYAKIRPLGSGWRPVVESMRRAGIATTGDGAAEGISAAAGESLTAAFLAWFLGCVTVYAALFGTGYLLYGELVPGIVCLLLFAAAAGWLSRVLPRVGFVD